MENHNKNHNKNNLPWNVTEAFSSDHCETSLTTLCNSPSVSCSIEDTIDISLIGKPTDDHTNKECPIPEVLEHWQIFDIEDDLKDSEDSGDLENIKLKDRDTHPLFGVLQAKNDLQEVHDRIVNEKKELREIHSSVLKEKQEVQEIRDKILSDKLEFQEHCSRVMKEKKEIQKLYADMIYQKQQLQEMYASEMNVSQLELTSISIRIIIMIISFRFLLIHFS